MTSRERVEKALSHQEPDRIPIDLGGSVVTGIQATALDKLQKALGIKDRMVKVYEPMMFLGEVENDIIQAVGGDVVGLHSPTTLLGYWNKNWKPWQTPDGTTVLLGGGFEVSSGEDGTIYAYPQGNRSAAPSAKMPADGYYFDCIIRQRDLTNHVFDARKDYADQYGVFSDEVCRYYEETSRLLYEETDYALFGNFFLGGVGDIFHIPAPWLENPLGIRDLEQWIMAHYDHPDYVKEFFELHSEITMKNLELYRQAVGDRLTVIAVSGTDFGTQNGPFISPATYREFYQPYHRTFNDWIHQHTNWKTFFHSCGSVVDFIEDFIDAGVDIINPVQFTAAGMDLATLKDKYGGRIVLWGGGTNPQKTLPFGTPEEIEREVRENLHIVAPGGGYVFSAVHNIQGPTPPENILTMFKSAAQYGTYPRGL